MLFSFEVSIRMTPLRDPKFYCVVGVRSKYVQGCMFLHNAQVYITQYFQEHVGRCSVRDAWRIAKTITSWKGWSLAHRHQCLYTCPSFLEVGEYITGRMLISL